MSSGKSVESGKILLKCWNLAGAKTNFVCFCLFWLSSNMKFGESSFAFNSGDCVFWRSFLTGTVCSSWLDFSGILVYKNYIKCWCDSPLNERLSDEISEMTDLSSTIDKNSADDGGEFDNIDTELLSGDNVLFDVVEKQLFPL